MKNSVIYEPWCPVCKKSGNEIYRELSDVLYNAPLKWNFTQCCDKNCKTIWLNPRPSDDLISSLYDSYSTHVVLPKNFAKEKSSFFSKVTKKVEHALMSVKLKYPTTSSKYSQYFFYLISFLHPAWRDARLANLFYLPYVKSGKVLDIGCGNGSSMFALKKQGWQTVGLEFDQKAVLVGRKNGLDIIMGDLYSQYFSDESFDAITMNHSIEHIPNVEKLLRECKRILKPGGVFVSLTPNANSIGSNIFTKNWRGLETPRHIQIFTPFSLKKIGMDTGFSSVQTFSSTQGEFYILKASYEIWKYNRCDFKTYVNNKYFQFLLFFIYGWLRLFIRDKDEVAVLLAKK